MRFVYGIVLLPLFLMLLAELPPKKLGNVLLGFYDKEDFCLVNHISNCQRTKGKDKTSVKESQSLNRAKLYMLIMS